MKDDIFKSKFLFSGGKVLVGLLGGGVVGFLLGVIRETLFQ